MIVPPILKARVKQSGRQTRIWGRLIRQIFRDIPNDYRQVSGRDIKCGLALLSLDGDADVGVASFTAPGKMTYNLLG